MELALAEWPKLSDREIARICAVSHNFVSEIRPQVSSDDTSEPQKRIGGDGKQYPASKPAKPTTAPAQSAPIPESKPATSETAIPENVTRYYSMLKDFIVAIGVERRVNVNQVNARIRQLGELFKVVPAIDNAGVNH